MASSENAVGRPLQVEVERGGRQQQERAEEERLGDEAAELSRWPPTVTAAEAYAVALEEADVDRRAAAPEGMAMAMYETASRRAYTGPRGRSTGAAPMVDTAWDRRGSCATTRPMATNHQRILHGVGELLEVDAAGHGEQRERGQQGQQDLGERGEADPPELLQLGRLGPGPGGREARRSSRSRSASSTPSCHGGRSARAAAGRAAPWSARRARALRAASMASSGPASKVVVTRYCA